MQDENGTARPCVLFIGLGVMGLPMAANLATAGFRVFGVDADPGTRERVEARGIAWADSASAAARIADVVITMLPNGRVASEVGQTLAPAMRNDALYIDMSTIAPQETDALARLFGEHGVAMVDAPVARSSKEAEEGRLLIMCGGSEADIARAMPLFENLADTVRHCGPVGSGCRMKLVNNYMSLTINVVTAEALAMGERSGLSRDTIYSVLSETVAGKGHLTTTYPAKAFKGDLDPGFMIDLARKDIGLILDMAGQAGVPGETARAALRIYDLASRHGRGRQDHTAIYDMCVRGGPWT